MKTLEHLRWGFIHRAETDILRACLVVAALGLVGMYAIATLHGPLLAGWSVAVLLVLAVLVRDGKRVGPPADDDFPTFIG